MCFKEKRIPCFTCLQQEEDINIRLTLFPSKIWLLFLTVFSLLLYSSLSHHLSLSPSMYSLLFSAEGNINLVNSGAPHFQN